MRIRVWPAIGFALLAAGCKDGGDIQPGSPPPPVSQSFDVRLQEVTAAAGLDGPMDLQAPAGDPRLFIAERPGRIRIVQNGALLVTPFLDVSSRVYTDGEAGLLSFAFDPQFPASHFVYVHFVENV